MSKLSYQVFISYASREKEVADLVCESLENNGIACWIAPESIPAGSGYAKEITEAIKGCKVVVLILSAPAMESPWVAKEIDFAIQNRLVIIPFHIDETNLNSTFKLYLNNVQRIEAYKRIKMALSDLNDQVSRIVGELPENTIRIRLKSVYQEPVFNIIGRQDELKAIEDYLDSTNIVALSGIGGIGKTELAKEYAKRAHLKNRYQIICFTKYQNSLEETIAHLSFSNFDENSYLASLKDKADASSITQELFKRKYALLEEAKGDTLIVFDGMDNLNDVGLPLLNSLSCHIILSTRCHFKQYATVNVLPFNNFDDQVKLFYSYYEDGSINNQQEFNTITNIIKLVGGHTLTIKLVAKFLQTTGYDPNEVLKNLEKQTLSSIFEVDQVEHEMRYETINDHINKLFKLNQMSKEEELILANLSFMPNNGVRKYLFKSWSVDPNTMTNVQKLIDKGWITSNAGYISLHPLINAVCIEQIKPNTALCESFLSNLMEYLEPNKITSLQQLKELNDICEEILQKLHEKNEFTVRLMSQVGMYKNSYLYVCLFSLKEKQNLNTSFAQVVTTNTERLKEFQDAHSILLKARQLAQSLTDVKVQTLAFLSSVLASSIFNAGGYLEALKYNQETLIYYESYLPKDSVEVLRTIRRMGTCAYYAQDYEKSYQYYYQNLMTRTDMRKNGVINDTTFARSNMYVANALVMLNKKEEALNYYLIAIEYAQKDENNALGVLELALHIAKLYKEMGNSIEAISYYQRAKDIYLTYTNNEQMVNEIEQIIMSLR